MTRHPKFNKGHNDFCMIQQTDFMIHESSYLIYNNSGRLNRRSEFLLYGRSRTRPSLEWLKDLREILAGLDD